MLRTIDRGKEAMLKQLRNRKIMKRTMQVTLFLIIPSFVLFYGWSGGNGGDGGPSRGIARYRDEGALLGGWERIEAGSPIVREATDSLYRKASNMLFSLPDMRNHPNRERLVRDFSQSFRRVATEAVNLRLIDQAAQDMQVAVSREEVAQSLQAQVRQIRASDPQRFSAISDRDIARQYIALGDFDALANRSLRRQRVEDLKTAEALLPLEDIWREYRAQRETISAEWVKFNVTDHLTEVSPTTETLFLHFQENADKYAFPDRREFTYVLLRRPTGDQVRVSTDTLRQYYDEHTEDYREPQSVQARVIRLRPPMDPDIPTTQAQQMLEQKIQLVDIAFTSDSLTFSQVADLYSEDTANVIGEGDLAIRKGGLLDDPISSVRPSRFGPDFDRIALDLAEGETTGPVRLMTGTFYIQAERVRPSRIKSFEEARDDIEQILIDDAIEEQFNALRDQFREASESQTSLEALARAMDTTVEGPIVVEKDTVNFPFGMLTGEQDTLLGLNRSDPRSPVLSKRGFHVVLHLMREIPAQPATYEEVYAQVMENVRREQAAQIARDRARAFLEEARQGDDGDQAFTRMAQTRFEDRYTTGDFTRANPALGKVDMFTLKTADVSTGTIRMDEVMPFFTFDDSEPTVEAYAVWRVMALDDTPTRDEFLEEAKGYLAFGGQQLGSTLLKEWLADRRREVRFEPTGF